MEKGRKSSLEMRKEAHKEGSFQQHREAVPCFSEASLTAGFLVLRAQM